MSVDLGVLSRPFATIQQVPEPADPTPRISLAGRLAYLDQRLKELRAHVVLSDVPSRHCNITTLLFDFALSPCIFTSTHAPECLYDLPTT